MDQNTTPPKDDTPLLETAQNSSSEPREHPSETQEFSLECMLGFDAFE